ncbi:hypothetical protein [Brevundimonas sp. TWP2-3-4b1]|uniref:hypothetical protein n=1 Tax=Brevundimonas sp. TWP2-3-4b1 TaxID=2804580 RepID=UPI003CE8C827
MTWGKFVLDEAEHDLTHLDPFVMSVTPKAEGAPTFRVLVSFSHHAFTREFMEGDREEERFGPVTDVRCFCLSRLVLSSTLPKRIHAASKGKAYFPAPGHAKQRNFLLVEISPYEPPYLVAFNFSKARGVDADVVMFVVSAHPRPGMVPKSRMDSISFATLVSKVASGQEIKRPPIKK